MDATMKGEEKVPGKRNIYEGKGSNLTVSMYWEAVVQTAQGEGMRERSEKVGMRRRHRVSP